MYRAYDNSAAYIIVLDSVSINQSISHLKASAGEKNPGPYEILEFNDYEMLENEDVDNNDSIYE
jgi:hypothetical protein